ncbi:hypothetical protein [Roseivivax isoporae]|uniref:Precorrin-3B synthase n=1 Tax=Roseivivax isoporae LMG 25204 TaxID=1449351 RepID=X7F5J5_9RHOB|nr:hypothetical protein [Roseivivax isoporae]ETX28035.1 precorrin-3B synthase [Roseivivax isoporae LMG 25204]
MSTARVRGWCPGALTPMLSGDGYVLRVRPRGGRLSANEARALAALAARHGSGTLEITQRANLQIRGISAAALPALQQGLAAAGLVDDDAGVEARRNVVVSPFDDDGTAAPLARALEAALGATGWPPLPSKFGFAVDAGPAGRRIAAASGDVRIERCAAGILVRADGARAGRPVPDAAAAVALARALAEWFAASGGIGADGRGRMARHLARGAVLPPDLAGDAVPDPALSPVPPGPGAGGLSLGAAFGLLRAERLAGIADRLDDAPLCVTPFRTLFVPGAGDRLQDFAAPDLVTASGDPRLRVVACTGAPGCPQAEGATRPLAAALAARVPEGALWHVSGCAKGCANPRPADVTAVARGGRYDLVMGGAPWEEPSRRGLSAAEIEEALGT